MFFWNDKNIIIVYKNKIFKIERDNKESIDEAINYGINLGIPKEKICFDMEE